MSAATDDQLAAIKGHFDAENGFNVILMLSTVCSIIIYKH